MKIKEFKVEVAGGSVYVKKWIPENAATDYPLIMLHDSLGCVDLWKNFPSLLAKSLSRCVIAYDRLGFGKSDVRSELPSIEFIEEEAITYFPAIKKHLSIHHYALLGHSVGGSMAVNIAARDQACLAVITVSAQAFIEDLTIEGIEKAKHFFDQPEQLARLEKWHDSKAIWVLRAWTNIWLSADFSNWSLMPSISHVYCPILVIHGDDDEYGSLAFPTFISKNTSGLSKMLLLKNCGHIPHKEKPQEVLDAIEGFIDKINS